MKKYASCEYEKKVSEFLLMYEKSWFVSTRQNSLRNFANAWKKKMNWVREETVRIFTNVWKKIGLWVREKTVSEFLLISEKNNNCKL